MAKLIFFFALAVVAVVVNAAPVDEEQIEDVLAPNELVPEAIPRVTCDLLTWLPFNACNAHCIARGFRGGWCERGVCICRR